MYYETIDNIVGRLDTVRSLLSGVVEAEHGVVVGVK